MKLEITSLPKGTKTQFICLADGVEIGRRCSARPYVKCVVVKLSKSFTLRAARSAKTHSLNEAARYGRGADCKNLAEFIRVFGKREARYYEFVEDGSYAKWAKDSANGALGHQKRIEEIESGAADAEFDELHIVSWHMSKSAKIDIGSHVLVAEVFA